MLPVELLHRIAATSPASYRAMLAVPPFARSLDPGIIADYMTLFGHSVTIDARAIKWWRGGEMHRIGAPAVEYVDGYNGLHNKCYAMWYRNGRLHREDGPAVMWLDGSFSWHRNNKLHREDGPARRSSDGTLEWYRGDKLHRYDGPAVVYPDGGVQYYEHGKEKPVEIPYGFW